MQKFQKTATHSAMGWVLAATLILVWQIAAVIGQSIFFPPPSAIATKTYQMWFSAGLSNGILTPAFFEDVTPSIERLLVGMLIAIVTGISVGVVLGRVPVIAQLVEPILHFMRALPGPVLLPLFLVLLGTGTSMRITLIAFGSVWPLLFNTYSAVRRVPEAYTDTARVSRLSSFRTLFMVVLPAASTGIFAGIRISMGLGVILLVAAELVASTNGIGFGLTQSQRSFNFLEMWAFIAALSVLGYIINLVVSGFERVVLRWHRLYKAVVA